MLKEFKQNTQAQRKKESDMEKGFEKFQIQYEGFNELGDMEKEIENLEEVWGLKKEWDDWQEEVKTIRFQEFNLDNLDERADDFLETVSKYSK